MFFILSMTNAGKTDTRRTESKTCPICGAVFVAQPRVTNCKKCNTTIRQRRCRAKNK